MIFDFLKKITCLIKAQFIRSNRGLAKKYLRGIGVEFGPLQNPVPLHDGAKAFYIDYFTKQKLHEHHDIEINELMRTDVYADAHYPPFKNERLNFLIANHILEHLSNPLLALEQWFGVLKKGGMVMLTIPIKDFTFDKMRPKTSLAHLICDYQKAQKRENIVSSHFEEWVEYVENIKKGTQAFFDRVTRLKESEYSIHMHAWDVENIIEILDFLREKGNCLKRVRIVDRTIKKNGIDATFIIKKE